MWVWTAPSPLSWLLSPHLSTIIPLASTIQREEVYRGGDKRGNTMEDINWEVENICCVHSLVCLFCWVRCVVVNTKGILEYCNIDNQETWLVVVSLPYYNITQANATYNYHEHYWSSLNAYHQRTHNTTLNTCPSMFSITSLLTITPYMPSLQQQRSTRRTQNTQNTQGTQDTRRTHAAYAAYAAHTAHARHLYNPLKLLFNTLKNRFDSTIDYRLLKWE